MANSEVDAWSELDQAIADIRRKLEESRRDTEARYVKPNWMLLEELINYLRPLVRDGLWMFNRHQEC